MFIWHSSKIINENTKGIKWIWIWARSLWLRKLLSRGDLYIWGLSGELCGLQVSCCTHYVCLLLYIVLNCSCFKFLLTCDSSLEVYSVRDAVFSTLYRSWRFPFVLLVCMISLSFICLFLIIITTQVMLFNVIYILVLTSFLN